MTDTAKIPKSIKDEIHALVFRLCDENCYLTSDRVQNAAFMDMLINHPKVGKRIEEYVHSSKVRTYIKDAIINRYTKKHVNQLLESVDIQAEIERAFERGTCSLVSESGKVSLWRSRQDPKVMFIASGGTYVKWETSLKKALEYVSKQYGDF